MGQVQIYSRLDQEALESLQRYRTSIGLPAVGEFQRPPKIQQIGDWVDSLAYQKLGKPWDGFFIGTFRPITQRWRNPRGLAALETSVKDPKVKTLHSGDFGERLASHSPSEGYVQRFFESWVQQLSERLSDGLSTRVDFFVGFEAGQISGANHFHALLAANELRKQMSWEAELWRQYRERGGSTHDFAQDDRLLLWGYLYRTAGRSLVLPFDPGRGAGWYIAASYVGKKQLGWDISVGDGARLPRSPTKGGGSDLLKSPELARGFYHISLGRWHR